MTIWRGPGGTGSASSEVDTTQFQEFLVQAQAAQAAAEAARDAALAAETNAELAETNAETAEANAAASALSASDSAISAAASLDAFEDRYLGAKASDPAVDNDGNALVAGTQYFDTVANEIKVYNGTSWQSASVIGGTVTNLTVTNPIVGSITNGVVTTGSYANPAWITSLAGSKVSDGTISTAKIADAAVTAAKIDNSAVLKVLAAVYPAGSIYINAGVSTNPATLLGFGTWVAFGAGRVMVGLDGSNTLFDTAEETGGSYDASVVAHTHTYSGSTASAGNHTHTVNAYTSGGSSNTILTANASESAQNDHINAAGDHTHTFSGTTASSGSSGTNANIQPYITVYMWKRTS